MAAEDALGRQFGKPWQPKGGTFKQAQEYPVKGYKKNSDRVTAQQRLMGASRGYDVQADMTRKGIRPSLN